MPAKTSNWVAHSINGFILAPVGAIAGYLAGLGFSAIIQVVNGAPTTIAALSTSPLTVVWAIGVGALAFFYGLKDSLDKEAM